jgi:multidrug resistance efflux pump
MRWKVLTAAGVVLALAATAAVGFFYWPFGRGADELRLPGVVEIQEVRLGPRVAGRVADVFVAEGDVVKKDKVLVRLAAPELDAQLEQWQAKLRQAQAERATYQTDGPRAQEIAASAAAADAARARLMRLRLGNRPEEVRTARSDLASAEADARLAESEFERMQRLVGTAAPQADFDVARAAKRRGEARVASARAHLDLMEAGNRVEDIEEGAAELRRAKAAYEQLVAATRLDAEAADGRVAEAEGKVREIEADIKELTVTAPEPAVVEVLAVRKGDLVAANQPVVRVLRTADLWIKVYVPETELSKVRLDQEVTATVDGFPGRRFQGRIIQISSESEFTPRNVQSVDERRHQVFGVRVRVDDPQGVFKSGMAAEVVVPLHE